MADLLSAKMISVFKNNLVLYKYCGHMMLSHSGLYLPIGRELNKVYCTQTKSIMTLITLTFRIQGVHLSQSS